MRIPNHFLTALAALGLICTDVHAEFFQADATAGNQNASIGFDSDAQAGNGPVDAFAVRQDPANPASSANVLAQAGRGRVAAVSTTSSAGLRFVGTGNALASYEDVIFSWTGDGTAPGAVIRAGLGYSFTYDATASGVLGSINGRNYRSASYVVNFGSASDFQEVTFDVGGNSVPTNLGGRTIFTNVPVGKPVTVQLGVSAGSSAVMTQLNSPVTTSMAASLSVSDLSGSVAAPAPAPEGRAAAFSVSPLLAPVVVFDVPEGYTVNSVSMGIVDNVWIYAPVPEPATVLSMLGGLGVLAIGVRARRARR